MPAHSTATAAANAMGDHLAACLLEAVADENWSNVQVLLQSYHAPAFKVVRHRGIAPIHFAAGMEHHDFGLRTVELMLAECAEATGRSGGLRACIDATTDDNETALQVATVWGRTPVVRLLLAAGASLERRDADGLNALDYALREGHYELVKMFRGIVLEQKRQMRQLQRMAEPTPRPPTNVCQSVDSGLLVVQQQQQPITPQRIPYCHDRTSPYYINITHRDRSRMARLGCRRATAAPVTLPAADATFVTKSPAAPPSPAEHRLVVGRVNLFQLTRENLQELTAEMAKRESCTAGASSVERWRLKVAPIVRSIDADARHSLLPDDIELFGERLRDEFQLTVSDWRTSTRYFSAEDEVQEEAEEKEEVDEEQETDACAEDGDVQRVTAEPIEPLDESNFIRSPSRHRKTGEDAVVYQVAEKFHHLDVLRGLELYELKLRPDIRMAERPAATPVAENANDNDDDDNAANDETIVSTEFTVPLDYDTDALRAELTQFGAAPGPINVTTKRLYMKRLLRFKRDPQLVLNRAKMAKKAAFSIELERTLRSADAHGAHLHAYAEHIPRMVDSFSMQRSARQKLREGHLKKSFVYLLIDPRVSANLAAEAACGDQPPLATWERFLRSVFYVGKGKNGRPFDHLYDALEQYGSNGPGVAIDEAAEPLAVVPDPLANDVNGVGEAATATTASAKIRRIHSIWSQGKGVVCRPLFHNIIPTEAFTREAAIIDAIGLPNLTNVKAGDYYGTVRAWPMRERRQLGVALLHKALQVLLADGESQLRPDDLL